MGLFVTNYQFYRRRSFQKRMKRYKTENIQPKELSEAERLKNKFTEFDESVEQRSAVALVQERWRDQLAQER